MQILPETISLRKDRMKSSGWIILFSFFFLLMSCEQDGYDKGEGVFSYTQADFCEAHSNSVKAIDYVVTDEGETLQLTEPFESTFITTADSIYRTILYYNKQTDNKAQLVSIGLVPTLGIVAGNEFEGLKTDPVKLESTWVSTNGKYLNMAIWLKTGTISDKAEMQSIGMVCMEKTQNADGSITAQLRLHHSQGDVPQYYSTRYYVSLLTSQIDADSVYIHVNTYNGEVVKKLKIKD